MSITKAAIGSAFLYEGIGKLKGLEDTSLLQALNHVSKYSDSCWDFEKFRTAVERAKKPDDLLTYCVEQLKPCGTKEMNEDGTYPWEYNNLLGLWKKAEKKQYYNIPYECAMACFN